MRLLLLATLVLAPIAAGAAAPRAEIQVALCEPPAALEAKLALRSRGEPYETWHFDDDALTLLGKGVRLRLRTGASGGELTLKAAKQDCNALPRGAVPKGEGKCEYDVYGGTIAGAVSLTRHLDAATTRDLLARKIGVASVLSEAQAAWLRDRMHAWPLPERLRPLGPIANRVYTSSRYDVDLSTLPDGQRYAEIGDKVPLAIAKPEYDKLVRYLEGAGVEACASQEGQAAAKMKRMLATP